MDISSTDSNDGTGSAQAEAGLSKTPPRSISSLRTKSPSTADFTTSLSQPTFDSCREEQSVPLDVEHSTVFRLSSELSTKQKVFACHFHKQFVVRIGSGSSQISERSTCEKPFDTISHLKQHLLRTHCEKSVLCRRCGYTCDRPGALIKHLRQSSTCNLKRPSTVAGMMALHVAVDVLGKKPAGTADKDDWYRMWKQLFPYDPWPRSPYFEEQNQDYLATMFRGFSSHAIDKFLESNVSDYTQDVMFHAVVNVSNQIVDSFTPEPSPASSYLLQQPLKYTSFGSCGHCSLDHSHNDFHDSRGSFASTSDHMLHLQRDTRVRIFNQSHALIEPALGLPYRPEMYVGSERWISEDVNAPFNMNDPGSNNTQEVTSEDVHETWRQSRLDGADLYSSDCFVSLYEEEYTTFNINISGVPAMFEFEHFSS